MKSEKNNYSSQGDRVAFANGNGADLVWTDKKRILGMPISFTRYSVTDDRLFIKTGLLTTTQDEILLYRIRDLTFRQTLGQKIFAVGSVIVHSSDKTNPECELKNIKRPLEVKELIHRQVEAMKRENRMRMGEFLNDDGDDFEE